jgi:hypothetical protein
MGRIVFISILTTAMNHANMHVDRDNKNAKFLLDPDILLLENHGSNRTELRDIERIARKKPGDIKK